jgi:hypothetical protein
LLADGDMDRILRVSALVLITAVAFPGAAAADYWARLDRPWTNAERSKAIAFCRLQLRVDPTISSFVDRLMGKQIQNCMYALGWVGIAD